jgi:uncharacterized protein
MPGHLLFYSTRNAAKILLHESVLKSIKEGTLESSDEQVMAELGFLVSDAAGEKKEMMNFFSKANSGVKRFSAVVVLNLDCNLACSYCYEGKMKGKHYLSKETADLLFAFIEKDYISSGMSVNLSFYGGEPLLSLGMIKNISGRLKSRVERTGLDYGFTLITNGTLLTKKTVDELLPYGLKGVKVTLDGPEEIHNRSRPFRSGKGSFSVILGNIKDTYRMTEIQIGGNFTRKNYREFPLLLDTLLDEGVNPEELSIVRFSPVTGTQEKFALPEFVEGCESINEPWLVEAGLLLREEILKRGFRTSMTRPALCMIESEKDLVINYDGSIYKCPGLIGWKGLEAGSLQEGIKAYSESHGLDVWKRTECIDCEYLPLCFGGCRFMRLVNAGNLDEVDCRKAYYDATLESFVKQDIRYGLKAEGL